MSSIPDAFHDVLTEKPSIATLATYQPDGSVHLSAVWVDYDEERDAIHLNSERGRRKVENVENDPRAAVLVTDPDNPYRWISVNGEVEVTEEGARDDIDRLAKRYMGVDDYPNPILDSRVIIRISADEVRQQDPEG